MGLGDFDNNPATAPRPHHRRFSLFAPPAAAATTEDPAEDGGRHELVGADLLAAARARSQERTAWALTHGERPLPVVDADGHVIVPAETLAKQAAEAAEAEAERLAGLTPGRLAAVQTQRWVDWLHEYEKHRPTYLRLAIGPRAEMLARQQFAAYEWADLDARHPDGGRVVVRGINALLTPPIEERPRAFPNERVLDAIRRQFLTGAWLTSESNKPTPPWPTTIQENLDAMAAEREARAAAKRQPDYNWKLIIEGGRGW